MQDLRLTRLQYKYLPGLELRPPSNLADCFTLMVFFCLTPNLPSFIRKDTESREWGRELIPNLSQLGDTSCAGSPRCVKLCQCDVGSWAQGWSIRTTTHQAHRHYHTNQDTTYGNYELGGNGKDALPIVVAALAFSSPPPSCSPNRIANPSALKTRPLRVFILKSSWVRTSPVHFVLCKQRLSCVHEPGPTLKDTEGGWFQLFYFVFDRFSSSHVLSPLKRNMTKSCWYIRASAET